MTKLLDDLEVNIKHGKLTPADKTALKLEIGRIPEALLDNTDRNRTSPFAFTGNKFELRAVGSSANCALPMTVLNTIVADQLKQFKVAVDNRISKGVGKDESILKELQVLIKRSKNIRFEGNGYGKEWIKENIDADVKINLYGQELNPQTYSICKSDFLISGENPENIKGNDLSTLSNDQYEGEKFHYMIANPPYGTSWKAEEDKIKEEAKNPNGRFAVGLPGTSDGQLLFVQHLSSSPHDLHLTSLAIC